MLDIIEFKGKSHIVMVKHNNTYVMNRNPDGKWAVISLPKGCYMLENMEYTVLEEDEAYSYYKERMASFGYRRFPVSEQ